MDQTPTQPLTPPANPISPTPLPLIPILAIISTISLLLTGFFIFQNWTLQKRLDEIVQTQITPTPTPQILVPPTDPTANWQTYTSSVLGFELKYPDDWTLDDATQDQLDQKSNLYIYTNTDAVEGYLEKNDDQIDQSNKILISVNNRPAQRITIKSVTATTEYVIFPYQSTSLNNGSTIVIRVIYDDDGDTINQILSSFKLL
jgi:hypothetical protein